MGIINGVSHIVQVRRRFRDEVSIGNGSVVAPATNSGGGSGGGDCVGVNIGSVGGIRKEQLVVGRAIVRPIAWLARRTNRRRRNGRWAVASGGRGGVARIAGHGGSKLKRKKRGNKEAKHKCLCA